MFLFILNVLNRDFLLCFHAGKMNFQFVCSGILSFVPFCFQHITISTNADNYDHFCQRSDLSQPVPYFNSYFLYSVLRSL